MNSRPSITKVLDTQVDAFIERLEAYNKKLPHPRSSENFIYLRQFFKNVLKDHNARSMDVSSPEYKKIQQFALDLFPVKTFWNFCIDGRVLGILAHGVTAGVGSSIEVPGGILREFIRDKNGNLRLKEHSDFATYLIRAYTTFHVDTVAEVFDSHVGCAARLMEEHSKGRKPSDNGLLADVSHKLQMSLATKEFVAQKLGTEMSVLTIQTSFDPHNGFLYMGLETEPALMYAYKKEGYTEEVLLQLVEKEKILSTKEIAKDNKIQEIFKHYAFELSWKTDYVESAKKFWKAIADMREKALPLIAKRVKTVYPELESRSKNASEEIAVRSMLLLTSAFSGYLNNKMYEDAQEYIYPFAIHDEEGIRVSEGRYPPYKISMFTVFSYEEGNLPASIELSASLVRNNRRDGRIKDINSIFPDLQAYIEATVPIVVQEIVREELPDPEWKELENIDWKDLPEDWNTMSDEQFFNYLSGKGIGQFSVAIGINNLRKRMAILYYPYHALSSRLIENYKTALPVVADRYKKNRFIIPFIKLGL